MKINLELSAVPRGYRFILDGVELVKLDDDGEGSFVVAADVLPNTVPFCDDEEAEAPNDYHESNLHHIADKWAKSHQIMYKAVQGREIDLTTMDGMTDYGRPPVYTRSLTVDEYKKYRRFIPLTSCAYWLATGYSAMRFSHSDNGNSVYCVYNSGSMDYISVYYEENYCPRPSFYMNSEIIVSMPVPNEMVDEGKKGLKCYTDGELIRELWNRAGRK